MCIFSLVYTAVNHGMGCTGDYKEVDDFHKTVLVHLIKSHYIEHWLHSSISELQTIFIKDIHFLTVHLTERGNSLCY